MIVPRREVVEVSAELVMLKPQTWQIRSDVWIVARGDRLAESVIPGRDRQDLGVPQSLFGACRAKACFLQSGANGNREDGVLILAD